MATTIEQQPQFSFLPVGQPVIFTISNDDIVTDPNFSRVRFTARVHISNGVTANPSNISQVIGTFKTTANNQGRGIFDLRTVIENFVSADNNATDRAYYKTVSNTEEDVPIHLIDSWSGNKNSFRYMVIRFKTEYLDSNDNYQSVSAANSDNFKLFNGYLKYSDILETGTGSEVNNFGYDIGKFFLTQTDRKFLTNAPLIQYANIEDYATTTISLLNGISNQLSGQSGAFFAPDSGLYGIRFILYEADGTEIPTTPAGAGDILVPIILPAYGGFYWADASQANNKIVFFGVGPANLRGYSTQFNDNIDDIAYYTYQAQRREDTGGTFPTEEGISEEYTVYINCPTLKGYKPIRLTWLNQWGGWDYYTFTMKSSKTTSTKGTTYQQLEGTWNDLYYNVEGFRGGKKGFRVNATEKIKMNTDFVSEAESEWFEELMNSPEVYILDGFQTDVSNSLLNNYVTPVRITSNSYTTKTVANDKLMQYTFEVEKSKTLRTQAI